MEYNVNMHNRRRRHRAGRLTMGTRRSPVLGGMFLFVGLVCVRAGSSLSSRDLGGIDRCGLRPLPTTIALLRRRGGGGGGGGWGVSKPDQPWGSSSSRPTGTPSEAPWSWQDLDTRTVVLEPRVVGNIKERDSRMGLIRKVYAILGVQLIVTAAVAYAFMQNRGLAHYLLSDQGAWALGLAFITALGSAIALCFPNICRTKPWNLLLLALFTGGESVFIGSVTAMYRASSVLLACGQTAVAVLGLTAYAFQKNPKYDLTAFGGTLASGILIFTTSALLSTLFKIPIPDAAVGGVGALLFSVFLVYDTQRVVGGPDKATQLDDRDYVRGALELYLDITRIFLYLLQMFGKVQSGKDN